MNLDVRIPLGMMFSLTGTILMAFGLATRNQAEVLTRGLGINVDLWWGAVLLVFGLVVLTLGRREQMRLERQQSGLAAQKPRRKK